MVCPKPSVLLLINNALSPDGYHRGNFKYMKKIVILLFSISLLISAYSCREKTEPEPVEIVDSTSLNSQVKFSYELLDSGRVKFVIQTPGVDSVKWYADWMRSKDENPEFRFEKNGAYDFLLKVFKKGTSLDSAFRITISNVNQQTEYATLKGVLFGKSYDLKSNAIPRNSFSGGGNLSLPRGTPGSYFADDLTSNRVYVIDFLENQGTDYETMKSSFKIGMQPLAQLKSYPTSDYGLNKKGWYILFAGPEGFHATGKNTTDTLEILEVKEVDQPRLFPEMADKALWVTWHIKTETESSGKMDCILKMKYIFYRAYVPF